MGHSAEVVACRVVVPLNSPVGWMVEVVVGSLGIVEVVVGRRPVV